MIAMAAAMRYPGRNSSSSQKTYAFDVKPRWPLDAIVEAMTLEHAAHRLNQALEELQWISMASGHQGFTKASRGFCCGPT